MVEKESPDKIRRLFGFRAWRSRWPRSFTQRHFLSPKREKIAKVLLLLGLSLLLTLLLIPRRAVSGSSRECPAPC